MDGVGHADKAMWGKIGVSLGCSCTVCDPTCIANIQFIFVLFLLLHNVFEIVNMLFKFQCLVVVLCLFFFSLLHLIIMLSYVAILVPLCYVKLITLLYCNI